MDFTTATYHITYNANRKTAEVMAEINFNAPEAGRPIFDSYTDPISIDLNGEAITAHFNASSIFFHTVPKGSVDGRKVPVTIYAQKSMWGGRRPKPPAL